MGLRDALSAHRKAEPSDVLELRVHGVNNTTAPALLDLRPEDVERVAGDKLGSFWRPRADAVKAIEQGGRGFVPKGVVREAYSWGGMVRTTPDVGSAGVAGVTAAAVARVFYALILPFSLANAVQWTRRLPHPDDRRPRVTAGLTRLFGLVLTLLFTTTAATIALDIGAAQCAADPFLCRPIEGLLAPIRTWTPGQQLALFALIPVLAAVALWLLSAVARLRYDVLPGMGAHHRGVSTHPEAATPDPPALLSHGGFWSNRSGRHLAAAHLAAAILLTTGFAAAHAAFRWHTRCHGLGGFERCVADASSGFPLFAGLATAAMVGLVVTAVVVALLPTTDVHPEEDGERHGVPVRPRRWPVAATRTLLGFGIALFLVVVAVLVFTPGPEVGASRLYGAGATPLVLVSVALAIAVSGILWRGRFGRGGDRRATAWHGCAPAVFMLLSLALAVGTSAIVSVTVGDWLNGGLGAATLVRDPLGTTRGLEISSSYVALGTCVLFAFVIGAIAALALLPRRDVSARARAWGSPTHEDDGIVPPGTSVLPPSPRTLLSRIRAKRGTAARLHAAEPLGAFLALVLAVALGCGVVWAWAAYAGDGMALWKVLPGANSETNRGLQLVLDITMPALAWVGVLLVATLASGAVRGGTRPLGIVWDIVCYLPNTGHPFGPPSYAERAVPEIAGRLYTWLDGDPNRRAVLAAHSMGGVLAVSALAVLASSPATRPVLQRVALLTFGIQLRVFFGRFLPELLGPEALGVHPSRAPRLFARDPWAKDFAAQGGVDPADRPGGPARPQPGVGTFEGTLLKGSPVRWISLWRLTDFLGFPAMSTAKHDPKTGFVNDVDRVAEELDLSGYMVEVGTHGEYYRVPAYERALKRLGGLS